MLKIISPCTYNKNWFGLIKCKILAPCKLYIPVLPVKVKLNKKEKLLFPLCLKCATDNLHECTHTDTEQEFVGTWSTVEVEKASEKGYEIKEIYKVWDFQKSSKLWRGYVEDFMRIKLKTSPHTFSTNQEYVRDIKQRMGISLDVNNIEENPGKRAVAKLCLNSLWGKFGQRQNMGYTKFITEPSEFHNLLLDDKIQNLNVMFVSENMVQVDYKMKDQYVEDTFNTNIFIAVYTTANARLRLYKKLDELGEASLYCDTDSIMYIDDGKNSVKTGDLLGEWTDELGGDFIKKWLTTGPKSYYYATSDGKECTKVKGFTLHYKNALKINGEAMERLITGEISQVGTEDYNIVRDKRSKDLQTVHQSKTYGFGFDKRVICEDFDTLPYDY